MDDTLFFILLVAGFYVLFRATVKASQQSAREDATREILAEYFRKKRIDELYGRDSDDESR